jgi:hypothetical protein
MKEAKKMPEILHLETAHANHIALREPVLTFCITEQWRGTPQKAPQHRETESEREEIREHKRTREKLREFKGTRDIVKI